MTEITDEAINTKPPNKFNKFSMRYVLRLTARNTRKAMEKCLDKSIRITFERIEEFADDQEKSKEIFETLARLHGLRRNLNTLLDESTNIADNLKGK